MHRLDRTGFNLILTSREKYYAKKMEIVLFSYVFNKTVAQKENFKLFGRIELSPEFNR